MSSQTATFLFIGGIALLMAAGFLVVWWRDKRNSDEVEADPERLDTAADTPVDLGVGVTSSTPLPTARTPR
jgi:hypothetical protein